ncbi:hypothetical protein JKF63_03393 [Porcisia hertigi]|uniref:PI3K/PI4K catalytic domain-containing protein n=1 Tax=Porcisia hertigi TaxID=2761500 RepID=A0A836LHA2_9TRYP|nr:hypothetical protein JKF63_03393 [Porcisia hertigi]
MPGSCTSRRVAESEAGGLSATLTFINTTDRGGPVCNCSGGLLSLFHSSRELDLTSFDVSCEDERGAKGDRSDAFDIALHAKLPTSIYGTTLDTATDYSGSSKTGSGSYSLREDVPQREDRHSLGADAAATPAAGMTPPSSAAFLSTLLSSDQPIGREPRSALMQYESSSTRPCSRKCPAHVDPTCTDLHSRDGPMTRITATRALSTGSLPSSYVLGFECHSITSSSDRSGVRSISLSPRQCCSDSRCSPREYWTMTPSLRGVNEILMQSASASNKASLFHQALALLQVWGSPLSLELHGNSAGGTYMVRLARPPLSSVAATVVTTSDDSLGPVVAVFKPRDEEIGQESNPHANRKSSCAEVFSPGSGSRREVLAYRLDHGHNAGVPPTVEVESTYWTRASVATAKGVGECGVPDWNSAACTVCSMPGGMGAPDNGGFHGQYTNVTVGRGRGAVDDESTATRAAAAAAASTHSQIGSLQLFVSGCQEAADILPGHFDVDEVHALAIFDIRTLNGDRHGGNVLVCNAHRRSSGPMHSMEHHPVRASLATTTEKSGAATSSSGSPTDARFSPEMLTPATKVKDSAPHLIPIDHSYICPSGYSDPDYEWLSWPQSKLPFSPRNLDYIAALDAESDAELVRSALLAPSGADIDDISTLRQSTGCCDWEAARGMPEVALASLMSDDVQFSRAVMQGSAAACSPAVEGEASAELTTHHPPPRGGGQCATATSSIEFRMPSPVQTMLAQRAVEATTTTTTTAASTPQSVMKATQKKSIITSSAEASSVLLPTQTWGTVTSELPIKVKRGEILKTEELHQGFSSIRTDAMASAWLSSSSPCSSTSTSTSQALRTRTRQHVSAPVTYDRDAANMAAEMMRCTTRLLQIAALEFHMTAYEIGSLCRRPRLAQASLMEEVLEEARDYVTWELVWSKFDDVVRQRLARHGGPGQ